MWSYLAKMTHVLKKITHRNRSLNPILIKLWLLLASPYRLKYLKESRRHKSCPELLALLFVPYLLTYLLTY
jgi:hypothetical protein